MKEIQMKFDEMRKEVYNITMMLCEKDLIRLSAGNISLHDGKGNVAITPSGLRYDHLTPEDIPIIDLEGNMIEGDRKPSSETPMHTAILRDVPGINGVVHTHSPMAIALGTAGIEVPRICVELLLVGAPIPVAPYTCPGTVETGKIAVEIFNSRPLLRCLMLPNHGLISMGKVLYDAYVNAYNFETGASVFHSALQVGKPTPLSDEQLEEFSRVYNIPMPT
jgi:L-ribulose-5-phosphate 4-epimerase